LKIKLNYNNLTTCMKVITTFRYFLPNLMWYFNKEKLINFWQIYVSPMWFKVLFFVFYFCFNFQCFFHGRKGRGLPYFSYFSFRKPKFLLRSYFILYCALFSTSTIKVSRTFSFFLPSLVDDGVWRPTFPSVLSSCTIVFAALKTLLVREMSHCELWHLCPSFAPYFFILLLLFDWFYPLFSFRVF